MDIQYSKEKLQKKHKQCFNNKVIDNEILQYCIEIFNKSKSSTETKRYISNIPLGSFPHTLFLRVKS